MIKIHLKNNKAFTLMEMLVYMAISAIVLFTLTTFIFNVLSQQNRIESGIYLDSEARHVFARLEAIIQNANNINTPDPGQIDNSLRVRVDDLSKDPTVINVQDSRIVIDEAGQDYFLTGSNLEVTNFEVENLSTSGATLTIQIRMTLSVKPVAGSQSQLEPRDYVSSFTLREYE